MIVNRKFDRLAIAVIAVLVVAYATLRPGFRLRPDMPADFVDELHITSANRRTAEDKVARAYWQCAVSDIQWSYGYAHRLPDTPPPEFAISSGEFGSVASDSAMRQRYWRRLQREWYLPTTWKRSYGWSVDEVSGSLASAGQWLESVMHRLTRM